MNRRKFLAASGVSGTALLAGCLLGGGDDDTATIGGAHPLSGAYAPWGQAHDIGLEIAIDEANERDDTDQEFGYVSTDTEADAAEATSVVTRQIEQDGASMITGSVGSDVGIRTAETAEEMNVANLLLNSGTHAALSRDSRYTFRLGWLPAPTHVRADLEYVQEQGYESIGVVIADYAWGRAVETSFEQFFPDDIDVHIEVAPQGEDNFAPYLRDMPDDVDVMDYVGHPAGSVTASRDQLDIGIDVPILGVDAPQQTAIDALGEDVEQIVTRHIVDMENERIQEFGEEVAEREDRPIYAFEPNGYITGSLFADAVVEVGDDPEAIADYIRENEHDVPFGTTLEYTEWGEFDDITMFYSEFEPEAPAYYPDGDYRLNSVFETSELEAFDPEELDLD